MSISTQTPATKTITRPIPTNTQLKVDSKKMIVSKTDVKGRIIYGNDYFCELTGYKESELISSPHNIIRHPDMPKAIFHLMWEYLKSGRTITAVVKNMSKNGDYYWVTTDFEIKRDKFGNIQNYIAFRQAAAPHVVTAMEKIYSKLLEIEKNHNMEASIAYLTAFLEEKHMNYDQFILELAKPKGISALFFEKMKKLFS